MRAIEVIESVRNSLYDTNENNYRWSNERLLSLLNDALLDVATTTRLFITYSFFELQPKKHFYDLSEYALTIERLEFQNKVLDFITVEEAYKHLGDKWRTLEGKPKYVVFDKIKQGSFYITPSIDGSVYEFTEYNSLYGVITDITYIDDLVLRKCGFGDFDVSDNKLVRVYYTRKPKKVFNIDDELDNVVDNSLKKVLELFLISNCLKDNTDAIDIKNSNELLSFYQQQKENLINLKSINNTKKNRYIRFDY